MTLTLKMTSVIRLITLLAAFWGCVSVAQAQGLAPLDAPVTLPPVLLNKPDEPPIALQNLLKKDGSEGYYLLHLWASACSACIPEMKQLDGLHEALARQGFTVLFVAQDGNGDTTVPAFFRRHDIKTISSYVDKNGKLFKTLAPPGLPSTYLVTPKGQAIAMAAGSLDWGKLSPQ